VLAQQAFPGQSELYTRSGIVYAQGSTPGRLARSRIGGSLMEHCMRILADENIPLVEAFFAEHAEIRRMPGRKINRAALEGVDVLLVRSVTRVDRELLQDSKVRFVGTCTIGTDHLDLDYFS